MPFVITYYNIQVAPSGGFVLHFLLARLYILTFKISRDHCKSHGFHSFFPPLFFFLNFFLFFFCIIHLPLNILHLSLISYTQILRPEFDTYITVQFVDPYRWFPLTKRGRVSYFFSSIYIRYSPSTLCIYMQVIHFSNICGQILLYAMIMQ